MKISKLGLLSGLILITFAYMISGCGAKVDKNQDENKPVDVSVVVDNDNTPSSTVDSSADDVNDNTSSASNNGEYLISDDGPNVCDGMKIWGHDAKEFYIMRVKDDYLEIPGECKWVYSDDKGAYPDLEDGQIALVVADVQIYDGGEVGYTHNSFITNLISYDLIDYCELDQTLSLPDAGSEDFAYDRCMFKYEDGDKLYLLVMNRQYIDVYLDGSLYMEYEINDSEDAFAPFFESL